LARLVLTWRGVALKASAHVPECIVKVEDGGHLGVDPVTEITENARWLQDGLVPVGAHSPGR
jgi:hypothetical protein